MADLTDLAVAIAGDIKGRAPAVHTHTQAQVTGLVDALAGKRDVAPMTIDAGVNLNDVTTPGEHSQQFTARATPELNYPGGASPVAGRLFVAANTQRTQVTQFYVPFTTSKLDIWMRNFYVSWSAWERIGMASDLALKANLTHPMLYDSGWRDITPRVPVTVTSGKVYLARSGGTVWLDFADLVVAAAPEASYHSWSGLLPAGFNVNRNWQYAPIAPSASTAATGPVRLATNGSIIVYNAKNGDGTVRPIQGLTSFRTIETPPASLPGTPA